MKSIRNIFSNSLFCSYLDFNGLPQSSLRIVMIFTTDFYSFSFFYNKRNILPEKRYRFRSISFKKCVKLESLTVFPFFFQIGDLMAIHLLVFSTKFRSLLSRIIYRLPKFKMTLCKRKGQRLPKGCGLSPFWLLISMVSYCANETPPGMIQWSDFCFESILDKQTSIKTRFVC